MVLVKEATWDEIMQFLQDIEKAGKSIPAAFTGAGAANVKEGQTVGQEARLLRGMFTKLRQSS